MFISGYRFKAEARGSKGRESRRSREQVFALKFGKSGLALPDTGRCGEMADAQDLKSRNRRFYRILLRFIQVAFYPVNIG